MIKRNLNSLLQDATPSEIQHGLDWYREARIYAYQLSKVYNVPFSKVCGVIAALSPRNKWERNKLDAARVISAVVSKRRNMPRCGTYKMMRTKAIDILKSDSASSDSILKILNGPKISAFYLNIFDGENNRVTVDTWIHLASKLEYLVEEARPVLKRAEYVEIETALKELSAEYGIKPYQAQAIVWLVFKRKSAPIIAQNRKAA